MLFWLSYFSCFASSRRVAKNSKTTSGHFCVCRRRLDFFFVSRGWFRFSYFKCPEVGLGFSLLSVQRLVQDFHFWVFRSRIIFVTSRFPEIGFELCTYRCPGVGSYLVTFVVVAAAAVSVVIWRYAIGRSLSIWNGLMMHLIIFFSRTLGRLARGARRRLSRLWVSICNIDIKTRWLNSCEEFDESSLFLICF